MFRFAVAAGCAAIVAEARRTGQLDVGEHEFEDVTTQTAPPGQCRRRRCPGTNPTIPPPTNAPGEPKQCDRGTPPTNLPDAILSAHSGLHYVGQGANACVYLSDEPPRAIKVSKWPSNPTLWSPRAECEKGQQLHAAACGNDELIAETETYLPTCTGGHQARGPGDDSYIMMHRAGGSNPTTILRLGEGASHKLPPAYQKLVFAELVSAIRLIHALGYTHNDLHDGNVMLDLPDFLQSFPWDRHEDTPSPANAPSLPRLAIIDLGEMRPYAQGWRRDYKRDFNSLWDRTAFLANCPNHNARWWHCRGCQEGAEAFVGCLKDQWQIDSEFEQTLWAAIHAATAEDEDQHLEQLFQTHFVQSHLPERDRRYEIGDACNHQALLQQLSLESTAPAGYEELPGKCTGNWIENWADGHYAHYGEDHHISGISDCADTCDEHPECAGFYTKNGHCSHWRSGSISARPQSGHTCYRKIGGGAPAPTSHHHHGGHSHGGGHGSATCSAVDGYNVAPGKCGGHWIEVWADGHFAHYGEDHHISGTSDCADTCDEHSECAGFYTKNGRCSHWRSGSISVRPQSGHCCYTKA